MRKHTRVPGMLVMTAVALSLWTPGDAVISAAKAATATVSAAATPAATTGPAPGKLVILSTTDVKGKTSPCGCHTPKGGLPRRASFADSVRTANPFTLIVDSGGFFPEEPDYELDAAFLCEAMKSLGVQASGLGDRELHYGRGFLMATLSRTKLPVVCANLWDRKSARTLVPPFVIQRSGNVRVGLFGLISEKADLGPSRDSLRTSEVGAAATQAIAAMRKQGATVIVLLSQLGKVETEDLVSSVDGIDVAIAGRGIPLLQRGRLIRKTVVCYGGEQSQYMGLTGLDLDAEGHVTAATNETFMLGPDVKERADVFASVKAFEDGFNIELRRLEKERVALSMSAADTTGDEPRDHYVGAEICGRCHRPEFEQWKTTAHARAWNTLVVKQVDARADCIPCHVLGYKLPGGFRTGDDAASLGNVQCESCHGMGTMHDVSRGAMAAPDEKVCRKCHDATTSPAFTFAVYEPHIRHTPPAVMPPLPPRPAGSMMMSAH